MSTFLLAWELGMGAGHCVNLLPVAKGLLERGHQVYVAPRDISAARHVFGKLPVHFLAAAYSCSRAPNSIAMPRTFAHILHNTGFGDQDLLETFVSAWRSLLEFVRPDVVVCEHAPMALLASHILGRRRGLLGTGFFSPPDVTPLPDLRHWLPPQPEELACCEAAVLDRINRVLDKAGKSQFPRLSSLYAEADGNFLLTFAELDHYPKRSPTEYFGMWSPNVGATPRWPSAKGPRVFAYLKAPLPHWRPALILDLLRQAPICGTAVIPGADADWLRQCHAPNLLLFAEPLNVREVATQCDFAVLNGNAGTATELLLRGVPQLHIPIFLEQAAFSRRVVDLGAGLMAEVPQLDRIAAGLHELQVNSSYRSAAQRFANHYASFDADESMRLIVDRLELLAS